MCGPGECGDQGCAVPKVITPTVKRAAMQVMVEEHPVGAFVVPAAPVLVQPLEALRAHQRGRFSSNSLIAWITGASLAARSTVSLYNRRGPRIAAGSSRLLPAKNLVGNNTQRRISRRLRFHENAPQLI